MEPTETALYRVLPVWRGAFDVRGFRTLRGAARHAAAMREAGHPCLVRDHLGNVIPRLICAAELAGFPVVLPLRDEKEGGAA